MHKVVSSLNLFYNFQFINLNQCVDSAGFLSKNNLNKGCITLPNQRVTYIQFDLPFTPQKCQHQKYYHWVLSIRWWSNLITIWVLNTFWLYDRWTRNAKCWPHCTKKKTPSMMFSIFYLQMWYCGPIQNILSL